MPVTVTSGAGDGVDPSAVLVTVTSYPLRSTPPSEVGASHCRLTTPLPRVAARLRGALGRSPMLKAFSAVAVPPSLVAVLVTVTSRAPSGAADGLTVTGTVIDVGS